MSKQSQQHKQSYSPLYKIYRRLRFVRHKRRAVKLELKRIERQESLEAAQIDLRQKEYQLAEDRYNRLKNKADREEAKRIKQELRKEIQERKKQVRRDLKEFSRQEKLRLIENREKEKAQASHLKQENNAGIKHFITSFSNFAKQIKELSNNALIRKRFAIISLNSTALFLLSYLAFFILSQVITVVAASLFNYPVIVHYYEIYFNISPDAWYHDSVKTIFSSGPLVSFAVGITFLIIYSNIREETGPFKLFFLWGFLHAVNMLFGAMLVGTLFETGLGYVVSWMYIMDTGKVLYSIISIFLLVLAGLLTTRQFLISGNTYFNEINKSNRAFFILSQVLIPYIIGNLALIILRQPRFIFYDTFIGLTMIICILPVLFTYRSYNELYFEEEEKKPAISWITLLILAGVMLFFRGALGIGIRIGG